MASIKHLPNIRRAKASAEFHDPNMASVFEVTIAAPEGIVSSAEETTYISEQVTEITGLDALQKTVQAGSQKFFGADASYLNTTLDNTYADITVTFNLNLCNNRDQVLEFFKRWAKLGYDLGNGHRRLMKDYISKNFIIKEANRDGTIWREIKFQKVMITNITGLDTDNYTDNEARKLQVQFRCDLWEERLAADAPAEFNSPVASTEFDTEDYKVVR